MFDVQIPLPGAHMVLNALAATAVGLQLGLTTEQIAAGIAAVQAVSGRSRVVQAKDLVLIDDCYNANPVSTKAALDLLSLADGRKVAVLGDMFELGEKERELHGQVGAYVAEKGIDCLYCAGNLSKEMYRAAKEAGIDCVEHFADTDALLAALPGLFAAGGFGADQGFPRHGICKDRRSTGKVGGQILWDVQQYWSGKKRPMTARR